jgi:hypothetical protein
MVKLVLIAEFEDADTADEAQVILDNFREAIMPSAEWGICLYCAKSDDLHEALLGDYRRPQ